MFMTTIEVSGRLYIYIVYIFLARHQMYWTFLQLATHDHLANSADDYSLL